MNSARKNKNYTLEFCRILFTFLVVFHHGQSFIYGQPETGILKHGYVAVDFFFMLSGYLVYRSFCKEEKHSSFSFAANKIKRLYPEYLPAAVLSIAANMFGGMPFYLDKAVNEILMVQNTGLFRQGGYNFPCWYIPVMLFAGLLIYGLLSLYFDLFKKVLLPIFIVGGYCFIFNFEQGLENWQYYLFVSLPVVRALAGMSVGVLVGILHEKELLKGISVLFGTIVELSAIVLAVIGLFTDLGSEMLTVFAFFGILWCAVCQYGYIGKALNKKCFYRLSEYSYSTYLNHALVLVVLIKMHKTVLPLSSPILRAALYLAGVVIWSVLAHKAVGSAVSRWRTIR